MQNECACGCGQPTNSTFCRGHQWAARATKRAEPPNPSGLCMCGCGRTTPLAIYTSHQTGNVKGEHRRYCLGHGGSYCHTVQPQNPSGLCMCNCGERTEISKLTRAERGYAAGQPQNFIHNHHGRTTDYVPEDRGFETLCWIWQKSLDKNGYGNASQNGKAGRAHRLYYRRFKGRIPKKYDVDHLCFVTSCVNPDHLEAVPKLVNQRRRRTTILTVEKVQLIHAMISDGKNCYEIASIIGIAKATVYSAHKRYNWKEVGIPLESPQVTQLPLFSVT